MSDLTKIETTARLTADTFPKDSVERVETDPARIGLDGVESETVPVFEEVLELTKRERITGRVRVSTKTELHAETAAIGLDRTVVDVVRVAIGRVVDATPEIRTEGNTTIIPVLEERLVVTKQLVLVEELHIRHRIDHVVTSQVIPLHRQHAIVERLDAEGRVIASDD